MRHKKRALRGNMCVCVRCSWCLFVCSLSLGSSPHYWSSLLPNKRGTVVHVTRSYEESSCFFQLFKSKLPVLPCPSTLDSPGPTATIIGQNQCWVYNNNNYDEWVLREGIRGWVASQAGLTASSGEVITSNIVEVPTQATRGALVLLAHLQVDARASIPGQREAKHALHEQVISQSFNKDTTHSLRQT